MGLLHETSDQFPDVNNIVLLLSDFSFCSHLPRLSLIPAEHLVIIRGQDEMFSFTQRLHRSTKVRLSAQLIWSLNISCLLPWNRGNIMGGCTDSFPSIVLRSGLDLLIFEPQRWIKCLAHSRDLKRFAEKKFTVSRNIVVELIMPLAMWTVLFGLWNLTTYVINSRDRVYFISLIHCDIFVFSFLSGNQCFGIALKWPYR